MVSINLPHNITVKKQQEAGEMEVSFFLLCHSSVLRPTMCDGVNNRFYLYVCVLAFFVARPCPARNVSPRPVFASIPCCCPLPCYVPVIFNSTFCSSLGEEHRDTTKGKQGPRRERLDVFAVA